MPIHFLNFAFLPARVAPEERRDASEIAECHLRLTEACMLPGLWDLVD